MTRTGRLLVGALVLAGAPVRAQVPDPHAAHAGAAPAAAAPALLDSDMATMAGMTPRDAMAAPDRPGWQWMGLACSATRTRPDRWRSGRRSTSRR
ncbi:MAG TPA: hypothetical protein VMT87_10005 [Vicinamibacteria bacterium]|nr:hypothetical protein [Vicinamibacteria bacterium]